MGTSSHEQRDQEYHDIEKKLRKREQRLLARLQEAQAAQASAVERFQRAEARLLKRMARTQRLEARLATLRQQLESFTSSTVTTLNTGVFLHSSDPIERPANEEQLHYTDETNPLTKVRIARAVAEATEETARLAVERALHVAARLEQMATGRHLTQELLSLEAEAARASVAALDAELAAQEAERLASAEPIDIALSLDSDTSNDTDDANRQASSSTVNDTKMPTNDSEMPPLSPVTDTETSTSDSGTNIHPGLPSLEERERVAEIDEDEEMVEVVAAMMIADVAAANAAKAESFAEEASSRTREACRFAQEADAALERIRAAIRSGTTTGDAAEAILFDAERDVTRTHAILADAESAEERARRAAMEAEAEAEVAEGMAFAAGDRNEHAERQREEDPTLEDQQPTGDTGEIERLNVAQNTTEKNLEDEDTVEVPIIRPNL
ncbi:MAG: hypothetical protein NVSMB38_32950 [Ktedonobacteraceae bacterium]